MLNSLLKRLIPSYILLMSLSFAQHLELETLSHWELHGPVHTVIERTINITQKDGETTETPSPTWSLRTFNEKGLLVENIVYRDSKVARRLVLSYNDAGQRVETIAYFGESVDYVQKQIYDENGVWIKTTSERNGEVIVTSINSQHLDFNPKKHDNDLSVLTLNDEGKPIERLDYEPTRGLVGKIVYLYNETGNLVEETRIDGKSGRTRSKHIYVVENGLILEDQSEDYGYGTSYKIAYQYDEYGHVLIETLYAKSGNEFSAVGGDTYSYEYDENGNWVRKFYPEEMQMQRIDVREITYY